MRRATVRALKRITRDGAQTTSPTAPPSAQNAALTLLARSVTFGHGRLAVIRLKLAVEMGAQVPHELWAYCSRAAGASQDARLQGLYRDAAVLATQRRAESAV